MAKKKQEILWQGPIQDKEAAKDASAEARKPVSKAVKLDTPPLSTDSPARKTVLSLFENPKVNEFIRHMGMSGKIDFLDSLLDSGALKATAVQRNRVKQLSLIKMAIGAVKSDVAEGRTWTQWFERVSKNDNNVFGAWSAKEGDRSLATIKFTNMEKALEDVAIEIIKNPNATLDSLLSKEVKDVLTSRGAKAHPKYWREFTGFVDKNGRVKDVARRDNLSDQVRELVNFMFEQRDYEGVRVLVEDVVFKGQFAEERKKLDAIEKAKQEEWKQSQERVANGDSVGLPDDLHGTLKTVDARPKTFRDRAEKAVNAMVSDSMINSWRKQIIDNNPKLDPAEIGKKVMEYRDMLISYQEIRLKNMAIFKKTKKHHPFGITNPRDLAILEQYRDGFDTHNEWGVISKQGQDFLFDQLLVNAPMIIVSGIGAAKFVHALGSGARFMLTNEALAGFTGLSVVEGATVAGGALAEGLVATAGRGKSLYNFARGMSLLAEGAAFNVLHTGLQGPDHLLHRDLPTWGKEIVMTTLTLGAFKLGGMGGRKVTELLSSNVKFFDDPVAKTITNFISTGSAEVGVMLALGAFESLASHGRLPDEPFVEQLIVALVTVGALRVVGGVAHIGGRTFKLGAIKGLEKAAEVSNKGVDALGEAIVESGARERARVSKSDARALKEINEATAAREELAAKLASGDITPKQAAELAKRANLPADEAATMLDLFRVHKAGWKEAALIALGVGAKAYEMMQPAPAAPVKAGQEVHAKELASDSRFRKIEGNEVYDLPGGGALVVPLKGNHGTSGEARTVSPRRHAELAKKSQEGINKDLAKLGVPKSVTDSLMGEYNQVPDELKKYTRMFVTLDGGMLVPYMSIDMKGVTDELLRLAGLTREDVDKELARLAGMETPDILKASLGINVDRAYRMDRPKVMMAGPGGLVGIDNLIYVFIALWAIGKTKGAIDVVVGGSKWAGGAFKWFFSLINKKFRDRIEQEKGFKDGLPTKELLLQQILPRLVSETPARKEGDQDIPAKRQLSEMDPATLHEIAEAAVFAKAVIDNFTFKNAEVRADVYSSLFKLAAIEALLAGPNVSSAERSPLLRVRSSLLNKVLGNLFEMTGTKNLKDAQNLLRKTAHGPFNSPVEDVTQGLDALTEAFGRLFPTDQLKRIALRNNLRPKYNEAVAELARVDAEIAAASSRPARTASSKARRTAQRAVEQASANLRNAKVEVAAVDAAIKTAQSKSAAFDRMIGNAKPDQVDDIIARKNAADQEVLDLQGRKVDADEALATAKAEEATAKSRLEALDVNVESTTPTPESLQHRAERYQQFINWFNALETAILDNAPTQPLVNHPIQQSSSLWTNMWRSAKHRGQAIARGTIDIPFVTRPVTRTTVRAKDAIISGKKKSLVNPTRRSIAKFALVATLLGGGRYVAAPLFSWIYEIFSGDENGDDPNSPPKPPELPGSTPPPSGDSPQGIDKEW